MSDDQITVVKRRAWSAVPDDILEDNRISLDARAVLGWMVGRHPDWKLYIRQMQHILGMTEGKWKSIRKELETNGYYRQERVQLPSGKLYWRKYVTDVPESPSPDLPPMVKTTGGKSMDGFPTGGETGDIPPIQNQKYLPPPPTSSRKPRSKASTPKQVVADLDELVEAAYWQAMKADKVILNPSAWRASVRKRIQENGSSAEDQSCLEDWRSFLKAKERRQAEEAEKTAKAAPVSDPNVARERVSDLSRSFGRSASRRKNPNNGETTSNQPQDDGEIPS